MSCGEEEELPDFVSLFPEQEESETKTESETDRQTETETESDTEPPFVKRIRIVLPEQRSEDLYGRAKELGDAIADRTGIPYTVSDDGHLSDYHPDVYELVIGESKHPDCVYWMRGLKKDDYVCVAGRYSVVLGGKTEQATFLALQCFTEQFLPDADPWGLIEAGTYIAEKREYEREFVSWNGVELSEWQIVYEPSENGQARMLAERLRDEIDRISGYRLPMVSISDSEEKHRDILLSVCEELGEEVHLIPAKESTQLRAGNGVGLNLAVSEFLERLFLDPDGDGSCENRLEHSEVLRSEQSRFHMGLIIGDREMMWEQPSAVLAAVDWIRKNDWNAVFVSELREQTARYIWQNLADRTIHTWASEEYVASCMTDQNAEMLSETYASVSGVLFACQIGGEKGGFRWLAVQEGTELPAWILEHPIPLVITVCGNEEGALADATRIGLDCLCVKHVTTDGGSMVLSVYATSDLFSLQIEEQNQGIGMMDLWVTRLH
ncbi:MAG: hypothetical protein IKA76_08150 [Clostridia bacterium]|nr:hypothetical protein [Clostridia bacterium]